MSLTYGELSLLVEEIAPQLLGASLFSVEEVDRWRWIFNFSNKKEELPLFVCVEHPFLRFHLLSRKGKTKTSPFQVQMQNALSGMRLQKMKLIEGDRILILDFSKENQCTTLVLELFSRTPNVYVLDEKQNILHSMHPVNKERYTFPQSSPSQTGGKGEHSCSSREVEERYFKKEKEFEFQKAKDQILRKLRVKRKALEKKRSQIQEDLEKAQQWESIQHQADLLQSNYHLLSKHSTQVNVWDWEINQEVTIPWDPRLTPEKGVARYYKKAKKLHLSLHHHQKRLEETGHEIEKLNETISTVEFVETLKELTPWFSPKEGIKTPAKTRGSSLPFRRFFSKQGWEILVAKTAKENERLTFSHAKGTDWWFHARNCPGSHVVLRVPKKGQIPQDQDLKEAAFLALFFSKEKGDGEVSYTQCKYLKKIKGAAPGKVSMQKEKVLFIRRDPHLLSEIKSRFSQSD